MPQSTSMHSAFIPLLVRSVQSLCRADIHTGPQLWKAALLLLAQHQQPTLPHGVLEDVHVLSHTAVRQPEDTALPSHAGLRNAAAPLQPSSAVGGKHKQVFISQVPYRRGQMTGGERWDGRQEGGQ